MCIRPCSGSRGQTLASSTRPRVPALQVEWASTGNGAVGCLAQAHGSHPEGRRCVRSTRCGAAPAACDTLAPEGTVGVDWQGPGRAGAAKAKAVEAQAQPRALCAGQQRHLLGGYLRSGDHGRLGVALQLPQVCGDTAAQAGREGELRTAKRPPRSGLLVLHPSIPIYSTLAPTAPRDLVPWGGGTSPWNRESTRSWLTRLGLV